MELLEIPDWEITWRQLWESLGQPWHKWEITWRQLWGSLGQPWDILKRNLGQPWNIFEKFIQICAFQFQRHFHVFDDVHAFLNGETTRKLQLLFDYSFCREIMCFCIATRIKVKYVSMSSKKDLDIYQQFIWKIPAKIMVLKTKLIKK